MTAAPGVPDSSAGGPRPSPAPSDSAGNSAGKSAWTGQVARPTLGP